MRPSCRHSIRSWPCGGTDAAVQVMRVDCTVGRASVTQLRAECATAAAQDPASMQTCTSCTDAPRCHADSKAGRCHSPPSTPSTSEPPTPHLEILNTSLKPNKQAHLDTVTGALLVVQHRVDAVQDALVQPVGGPRGQEAAVHGCARAPHAAAPAFGRPRVPPDLCAGPVHRCGCKWRAPDAWRVSSRPRLWKCNMHCARPAGGWPRGVYT